MEEMQVSETTTEATGPTGETTEQQQTQGDPADKPLGENGEKALKAERERANDLDKQLKAATARLTEIERASESELERAQRERDEAKGEAEKIPQKVADLLRDHLAAIHGIDEERRDLYLTSNDPETLLKQAAGLVDKAPAVPKPDPSQGGKGEPHALNSNGLEEALKSKLGIV